MPRLFVAVDLAPGPRAALAAVIAQAAPLTGARWTPPGQLHVTLRFFGSVPEARVPALRAALAGVRAAPFGIALAGVGTFPAPADQRPVQVLWAGVTPIDPLRAQKALIDHAVAAVVGPDRDGPDRAFTPHVTLARLPGIAVDAVAPFLVQHAALASAPWTVASMQLFESKTLDGGPVYQVIEEFPLRG